MKSGSTQSARGNEGDQLREKDLLAALPARSANREVKVGAFVLAGIAAFLIALFSLTDVGTFRGRYYVKTAIEDAGGMRNGDPVQMRGVNIGRVTGFDMVSEGVVVTMEIYNRYRIPEDSRVSVHSAGLLGGVVVAVSPGVSERRAADDQILPGVVEADIFSAAGDLSEQAEVVLDRVTQLLSEQTIGNVSASTAELQTVLVQLSAITANLQSELVPFSRSMRRSAENLEVSTENFRESTSGPELARSLANLDSLTTRLSETSARLNDASGSLEVVLGRLEDGEGTLGRLSEDEALYNNVNSTVLSLQALIEDIKANPRKYLNLELF